MTAAQAISMTETTNVPAASGPVKEARKRTWWGKNGRQATVWMLRIALFIAFIVAWYIASLIVPNPMFISTPLAVWEQLVEWVADDTIAFHSWITIQEVALGYFIGVLTGAIAGFILASVHLVYDVFEPFMMALYSIPKVALAP